MSKPLFTYTLHCETCGVRISPRADDGVPQTMAAIVEERRWHAEQHRRGEV